jgi:hypothetical protein
VARRRKRRNLRPTSYPLIREIQAAGYTSYNAIARATQRSEGSHRQRWPVETCAGAADFRPGNRAHSWPTLAAAPARLAAQAPGSLWPQWMVCNDTISYVQNVVRLCRCLPNWPTISPTARLICSATGPILQCPLSGGLYDLAPRRLASRIATAAVCQPEAARPLRANAQTICTA